MKYVLIVSISVLLIATTTGCAYPQTRQQREGWDGITRDLQSLGDTWATKPAHTQECHTEYRKGPFGFTGTTVCE